MPPPQLLKLELCCGTGVAAVMSGGLIVVATTTLTLDALRCAPRRASNGDEKGNRRFVRADGKARWVSLEPEGHIMLAIQ